MELTNLTLDQLNTLLTSVQAEIASRQTAPAAMTVQIPFDGYNDRRYSRPWIAVVSKWPNAGRAELTWGNYLGTAAGGTCEVTCNEGDVIRYGQKDIRGNGGTAQYAVVTADQRYPIAEDVAAVYFRSDAARRAELVARWEDLRAVRNQHLANYESLIAEWRENQSDRQKYNAALAEEKAANALVYSL